MIYLLVALALVASACGSSTVQSSVAAGDSDNTTESVTDQQGSSVPVIPEAVDDASAESANGDLPTDGARRFSEALAFALEEELRQSYTFTQGLAINVGRAGTASRSAEPYAFGEIDGERSHIHVDLEASIAQALGGLGAFGLAPSELTGQSLDVWTDGTTVTMDLSSLEALGDGAGAFGSGPVSVRAEDLDGIDVVGIVNQFGQGSQVFNPDSMFEVLESIEEATEVGRGTIGADEVTTYESKIGVSDFYELLGVDTADQFDIVGSIGLAEGKADAIASLVPAMEALTLQLQIMVDDDGRVRRVGTSMNMTELIVVMFETSSELTAVEGAPRMDLGALFGPDGLQIILDGWQEFNDYGVAPTVTIPEATDVTAEASALFAG
jgi:hypothetical protein